MREILITIILVKTNLTKYSQESLQNSKKINSKYILFASNDDFLNYKQIKVCLII